MKQKNKDLVSIKCPDCHKEIFGASLKACRVNLRMHNKSNIHKAILQYKEIIKVGVTS